MIGCQSLLSVSMVTPVNRIVDEQVLQAQTYRNLVARCQSNLQNRGPSSLALTKPARSQTHSRIETQSATQQ